MLDKKPDKDKLLSKDSDRHCIWMSAGVISFKLCPFNYDCEHCDFDAVMRPREKKYSQIFRDAGLN